MNKETDEAIRDLREAIAMIDNREQRIEVARASERVLKLLYPRNRPNP